MQDLHAIDLAPAIAKVHDRYHRFYAHILQQPACLLQLFGQGVAVVRIARKTARAHDQSLAGGDRNDWSDLKPDKSWCLLRAAVPVGGRTLTLLDMVVPGKQQGSPGAEKRFLQQLRALVPDDVRPILVTDAGFRTPWFRAVSAMGWC